MLIFLSHNQFLDSPEGILRKDEVLQVISQRMQGIRIFEMFLQLNFTLNPRVLDLTNLLLSKK